MARKEQPLTLLAEEFDQRMKERELGIKEVADLTGATYEHIRKILRGEALPSKYFLKVLCDKLDLDLHKMEKLTVTDRIRLKYGKMPAEISGKNPELEPVERVWPKLSKDQRLDFIAQIEAVARRNRSGS